MIEATQAYGIDEPSEAELQAQVATVSSAWKYFLLTHSLNSYTDNNK